MTKALHSNSTLLDVQDEIELILQILSFSGGENQTSEDHMMQSNEARVCENFEALSLGGMERSAGFTAVASGSAPVTDTMSLMAHFHYELASDTGSVLGVIDDDLVIVSGAAVLVASNGSGAFTADKITMGVTAADKSYLINESDGLQVYNTASGLASLADEPANAHDGIYKSKFRLIAEGLSRTVEYSRAGFGNLSAADAWTLANDAASVDLPEETTGTVPEFINGDEAIFTRLKCYHVFGVPNLGYRAIPGSRGCHSRHSIQEGAGGVFFLSLHPEKAIVFWDKSRFISLTEGVDWIDDVNTSIQVWSAFRETKYYFVYASSMNGKTYPDSMRVYDTKFNRWMSRPVNTTVGDNFGAMVVLDKQNNELYSWSSRRWKIYQLENGTADSGQETQAVWKTKKFSSRDFAYAASGNGFGVDDVTLKLLKVMVQYYGTADEAQFIWAADFDASISDSLTFDMTAGGAKLGSFQLGIDSLTSSIPDKLKARSLSNKAVGRRFEFQINHSGTGTKGRIKKIKIWATPVDEI